MIERGHPLSADSGCTSSEIPEWLQEFRENLVDDEVPERRDSHASSSHELSLEPTFKRRDRNNHRYAVVVQDLATQRIQSYPCKTKNFSGNRKELSQVLGAR